jgi:prepilin-type N-terminal cleavage/methylation domain-containing protein
MNGFAQNNRTGFTLIEIVVAIALLALVSALVIPRIRRQPLPVPKLFEQQLNSVLQIAKTNALETQKLHRIMFDLKNNNAFIEIVADKKDSQGKNAFEKLSIPYVKTSFPLNENLTVERFIVNGKNLMLRGDDLSYTGMWFYITAEGICQDIEIGLYDQDKKQNVTIKINPFFCKAEIV